MLEERCRALLERGDAATERAEELRLQVKELSEKLKATEELQEQKDALIEELRLLKQAKVGSSTRVLSAVVRTTAYSRWSLPML